MSKNRKPPVRPWKPRTGTVEPVLTRFTNFQNYAVLFFFFPNLTLSLTSSFFSLWPHSHAACPSASRRCLPHFHSHSRRSLPPGHALSISLTVSVSHYHSHGLSLSLSWSLTLTLTASLTLTLTLTVQSMKPDYVVLGKKLKPFICLSLSSKTHKFSIFLQI